jgi:hypothetical protein
MLAADRVHVVDSEINAQRSVLSWSLRWPTEDELNELGSVATKRRAQSGCVGSAVGLA